MLDEYGLSPLHKLGQNFLHDHNIIGKLVDASGVQEGELVVEVGPGTGALTEALLERGCSVIACELDKGLTGLLQDKFGNTITLIHGDCWPHVETSFKSAVSNCKPTHGWNTC